MNSSPESDQDGAQPLSPDLAFFGAITASVSHELNNVVSIIQQVIGLLEDQLYAAGQGAPLDPEKLRSIHDRIVKQSARGEEIVRNLNRFAHSVDQAMQTFELNTVLTSLRVLCGRFAELKRVRLEVVPSLDSVQLTGSPFLLHEALYRVLRAALDNAGSGDCLAVAATASSDETTVHFRGTATDGFDLSQFALLRAVEIVKAFDGRIDLLDGADGPEVRILLPALVFPGDL